mgnify:CR=1 FL=1
MSHPLWMRGLKSGYLHLVDPLKPSHPLWMRGLKLLPILFMLFVKPVASFMDAWIEIFLQQSVQQFFLRRILYGCVD